MATIRKQKNGKWRAEIRQQNNRYLSKTFFNKGSASAWAKDTENKLEKEQYEDWIKAIDLVKKINEKE
jgi:uncharacterized protein YegP (UPF0339 family)